MKPVPRRLQFPLSERRLLLVAGDLFLELVSVLVSLAIWAAVAKEAFTIRFIEPRAFWFIVLPALWLILAGINDFYNLRITSNRRTSMARMLRIVMQLLVIYLILFFFAERASLPRLFIFYHAIISIALIGLWRAWNPALIGWVGARRRALVIGTGWAADTIVQTINAEAPNDYHIVGVIGAAEDNTTEHRDVRGIPLLGSGADLPDIVRRAQIAELIIAYGNQLPGDVFQGLMACYEQGVTIVPMPLLYEQITGRVPIEHVGQHHWSVVLPLDNQSLTLKTFLALKRLLDIACALIGLAVFIVVLPLLALIMWLDSRGPIFFSQERVGRGGRVFKVLKLRSMIPDAEKRTGAVWATERDPRITRVGRFLRKSRLDEVPQLINVLRGEMSIVGPRPERPVFVDKLEKDIPFYRTRLVVKPGLTGWAQVCYRYGNTTEDQLIKLQYDLYYIRHQSITLDLMIMGKTIGKMLMFQGT